MKLKLTDKIKKFFGQQQHGGPDGDSFGTLGDMPQLECGRPPVLRSDGTSASYLLDMRQPGPAAFTGGHHGAASQAAAGEPHEKAHMPSTLSQKADLSSNPRTTGQDESFSLQNEVYFPQLILTLQAGTPEQKAVAAEALFNYTAESDSARQRATQAGVVGYLIDLLQQGTDHGKMYAAYTLSSLTSIEEALEQMCSLGAIPALISILSICPLLVCKKGAMRALGRLARNDQAAADIVAAGGLPPIIALLVRPDSSLVRRCLIALYFIGADKDALQQAIGAAGALPHLLALARSDSPDVQAEATDVLKVLCRNAACGRTLADMGGIETLAGLMHSGLTSRTKASAARALQRLNDIPDLKEQLASSSAHDMIPEGNSNSSLINTGTGAMPAAGAIATVPIPGGATAAVALAAQILGPAATAAAAVGSGAAGPSRIGPAAGGAAADPTAVEVDDVKQLAEVLASSANKWLREKAAAAVEQLAVDDLQACRELADLGAMGPLLDMLSTGNSGITRRAGARALGRMGDDAVLLNRMGETGFILRLLQAAPELSGSAQRSVLKLLHGLAHSESTVAAFPWQETAAHLMQIVEGAPLRPGAAAAAGGSSGAASGQAAARLVGSLSSRSSKGDLLTGSNGGDGDVSVAVKALEVLVAVSNADGALLSAVKDYPGGFRLLVGKLQHGARPLTPPILKLLACLATSHDHQEDLLKGGVVPVLLGLYRSDDASVAVQAARVMELLSEPAAQILERSLSRGESSTTPQAAAAAAPEQVQAVTARSVSPSQGSSNSGAAAAAVLAGTLHERLQDVCDTVSSTNESSGRSSERSVDPPEHDSRASAGNSSSGQAQVARQVGSSDGSDTTAAAAAAAAGRCASPSRAAAAAAAGDSMPPAGAVPAAGLAQRASRASSLGLGNPSSKFNAEPSRRGSSFTAKCSPYAVQADHLMAEECAARSSSPCRAQQQQQQQQQQHQPESVTAQQASQPQQQAPSSVKPRPRRSVTPEPRSSVVKQQAGRPPSAIEQDRSSASSHQPSPNAAGGREEATASPASPAAAAGTGTGPAARAASASRDRPSALGVEQVNRPSSSPSPRRPAVNAPRPSSAAPGSAAAQRQRLIAGRKPTYAATNLAAQQQQQPPAQDAAAAGADPALAGRPPVLQIAAAIAAATGATVASSSRPSAKQQQQQLLSPQQQPPPQQQQQQEQQLQASEHQDVQQQQQQQQQPSANTPRQAVLAAEPAPPPPFGIVNAAAPFAAAIAAAAAGAAGAAEQNQAAGGGKSAVGRSPDKAQAVGAGAGGSGAAADADDLLSSTYDNLHGLLMKKSDIEICRTAEGRKCRLGEGGFGVVYKAVMNGVDEVAVKLVKADSPSRKELELFLKEVQTLAKLHHRNIVQFYGACLETGSMFFVTELMKGGDLYTALRHHSETMRWERLGRKVALDVALGLNYLHAQRPPMMHRDLKSPNVLLSEEGVAKIADVGMVRSQVKDLVTAQPVMTPLWAAPEVVRHERASIKADIWSYGILIWELISGEDITEYQPLSISRQVGPSPNAKAMCLPAKCPAVARKLFMACTQMDPERRPGAQTLVEWLRADMQANRF